MMINDLPNDEKMNQVILVGMSTDAQAGLSAKQYFSHLNDEQKKHVFNVLQSKIMKIDLSLYLK